MRPPDLPLASVLAAKHPHGVRVRYSAGCRCEACRTANREGVGYKQVATTSNVARSTLGEILFGDRKFIRAHSERKILAVTAAAIADGALVPAAPAWEKIDSLVRAGFSKSEIARRLNYKNGAIQLRKTFITARNASQVDRLYSIIRNKGVELLQKGAPLERQART